MIAQQESKRAAISVSEMAAMCGLSRSRFYDLMQAGLFPKPVQETPMKRPVYVRDLIDKCLEIRRTGVGLDGKIVVFNRMRTQRTAQRKPLSRPPQAVLVSQDSPNAGVIAGLKSLGLSDANESQVGPIVRELFPNGRDGHDLVEIVRAVFLRLKKQQG